MQKHKNLALNCFAIAFILGLLGLKLLQFTVLTCNMHTNIWCDSFFSICFFSALSSTLRLCRGNKKKVNGNPLISFSVARHHYLKYIRGSDHVQGYEVTTSYSISKLFMFIFWFPVPGGVVLVSSCADPFWLQLVHVPLLSFMRLCLSGPVCPVCFLSPSPVALTSFLFVSSSFISVTAVSWPPSLFPRQQIQRSLEAILPILRRPDFPALVICSPTITERVSGGPSYRVGKCSVPESVWEGLDLRSA